MELRGLRGGWRQSQRDYGVLEDVLDWPPAPARQAPARRRKQLFGDLFYIGVHFLKGQELYASFD